MNIRSNLDTDNDTKPFFQSKRETVSKEDKVIYLLILYSLSWETEPGHVHVQLMQCQRRRNKLSFITDNVTQYKKKSNNLRGLLCIKVWTTRKRAGV